MKPPPMRSQLAFTWGAVHRAEKVHDIRSMALTAALTATWIVGGAIVGLSMIGL